MELKLIYDEINLRIKKINFSKLWRGFKPYKFAIYTDETCYFNDAYIEKTDDFYANTSIKYNDEFIAIWHITKLDEDFDFDQLTASIVHEMFHAFQQESGEKRYPNEMEALMTYAYDQENIAIKLEEIKVLISAIQKHDKAALNKFLEMRKYRLKTYRYAYTYESKVEQIEGSALYVELHSLKQLNLHKADFRINDLFNKVQDVGQYFPIRVISYKIGALLIMAIKKYEVLDVDKFSKIPFSIDMLIDIEANLPVLGDHDDVLNAVSTYKNETQKMIHDAISKEEIVLEGSYPLLGLNIYDARSMNHYVVTTYFFMYQDNDHKKVMNGDFVLEINDSLEIKKAYKQ